MLATDRPPLFQYWHDPVVPDYVQQLLAVFRERNPDLRQLVFSEPAAAEFIAEHYGAREVEAFGACAIPAMQADYFRYCAVLATGGVFSDVDFDCIGRLGPLVPVAGDGRLFGRPTGPVINGLFAFGAPGHDFLRLALEIATANIERRLCNRVYYTTGPPIFGTIYKLHRLGSFDALLERCEPFQLEFTRAYCEVIGDVDRVSSAMRGITVLPEAEFRALVRSPDRPLPYKQGGTHWTKLDQEIFR